jgi:hypothetical protein
VRKKKVAEPVEEAPAAEVEAAPAASKRVRKKKVAEPAVEARLANRR